MKKQSIRFLFITFCLSVLLIMPILFGNPFYDNKSEYSDEYIEYLNAEDKSKYGDVIPMQYSSDYEPSDHIVQGTSPESYYCLRDDYQIYTKNQDKYGICYACSCTTALETLIAINYGEFYDFSPAWTSLSVYYLWKHGEMEYIPKTLGGGGNVRYFQNAKEKCGLMLSTDFDLANLYSIDKSNYEVVFNDYKDKTIDIGLDYSMVTYSKSNSNFYTQVKNHIKTNGSLYATCYSDDIDTTNFTLCSETNNPSHAVSIIGWDDNFKADGWTNYGAWIALNSWGDHWGYDGVFYISYNDATANNFMYGFELSSLSKIQLTSDFHTPMKNHYARKYTANTTNADGEVKDKNIYKSGESVNLSYSFTNFDFKSFNVQKNGVICTDDFESYISSNSISLSANSLSPGTYKINFVSSNQDVITKELIIIDGLEIGSVIYNSSSTSANSYTGTKYFFDNYNSYNKENTHFEIFTKNYATLRINLPSFSKLASVECTSSTFNTDINDSNVRYATQTSYASGYIIFRVYTKNETTATATLRLTSIDGTTKDLFFTAVYVSDASSTKYVYVIADYSGEISCGEIPRLKVVSANSNTYLPNPTNENCEFYGWYFDSEFSTPLNSDSNGYYLSYDDNFTYCTGTEKFYPGAFYYIKIYARYKFKVTYSFNGTTQTYIIPKNGTSTVPEEFNLDVNGYKIVWDKNIEKITGDILITGTLKLDSPIVDDVKIDGETKKELDTTYKNHPCFLEIKPNHSKTEGIEYFYKWMYSTTENGTYSFINNSTNSLSVGKVKDSGYYKIQITASDTDAPTIDSDFLETTSVATTDPIKVTILPATVTIKIDNKRSAMYSKTAELTYKLNPGSTVYDGDDLMIEFISSIDTLSAGTYKISAKSLNSNYKVNVIEGEYEVYYESINVSLIVLIIVVISILLIILIYFVVTKIISKSYLKNSKLDKKINDL